MEIIYLKTSLGVIFGLSVIGKLTGKTKSTFEKAGYRREVLYAIAVAEIFIAIAMFTRYEMLATLGLLAIIGGAFFTLYRQRANPARYTMAIIAAILLAALL